MAAIMDKKKKIKKICELEGVINKHYGVNFQEKIKCSF